LVVFEVAETAAVGLAEGDLLEYVLEGEAGTEEGSVAGLTVGAREVVALLDHVAVGHHWTVSRQAHVPHHHLLGCAVAAQSRVPVGQGALGVLVLAAAVEEGVAGVAGGTGTEEVEVAAVEETDCAGLGVWVEKGAREAEGAGRRGLLEASVVAFGAEVDRLGVGGLAAEAVQGLVVECAVVDGNVLDADVVSGHQLVACLAGQTGVVPSEQVAAALAVVLAARSQSHCQPAPQQHNQHRSYIPAEMFGTGPAFTSPSFFILSI
jgi:hypothetical protein